MARLSKVLFVAALVAMLAMAPVLEARPLTEASAVSVGHERKLHIFGEIIGFKLCLLKKIVTFGFYSCHPKPVVVVEPKPEEPKKDDDDDKKYRKQA